MSLVGTSVDRQVAWPVRAYADLFTATPAWRRRLSPSLCQSRQGRRNPHPDYFVPPGVLCRIIRCPGALNELPGAVADVRLFSICCPGAELRLCAPVDWGAALASETLSASDTPAMIKVALYMMTSFQI